jgi:hypothetical protein
MFSDGGDPAAEEIERFLREAWARDLNLAAAPRS